MSLLKTLDTELRYLFVWLSKLMTRPFFGQFQLFNNLLFTVGFSEKTTDQFLRYSIFVVLILLKSLFHNIEKWPNIL